MKEEVLDDFADEIGQPLGGRRVLLFADILLPPLKGIWEQCPQRFLVGVRTTFAKNRCRLLCRFQIVPCISLTLADLFGCHVHQVSEISAFTGKPKLERSRRRR